MDASASAQVPSDTSVPGDTSGLAVLAAVEQATINAIERAERSVVAISRVRSDRVPGPLGDFQITPNLNLQEDPASESYVPEFFGSGVVLSSDGYILTCAHVLDDPRRNEYFVWLGRTSYRANLVGRAAQVLAADPFSDLAVLKIDASDLVPIALNTIGEVRKGQFVIALGNPQAIARDGQASASWGIISNLNRFAPGETNHPQKETIHQLGTLIQTDARLNLGTSGGALINLQGEMVGLTTSLAALSGFEQSAGFAIAVDELFLRVVESLKQGKLPEYGFLGIQPEDVRALDRSRGMTGARVSVVIPGLPGERAGLRPEDVIFQVGRRHIDNRNDLFRELSKVAAGESVDLHVHRIRPQRAPQVLVMQAELSKKFVSTARPSFAVNGPPTWRGAQVEYVTAIPAEVGRAGRFSRRGAPELAILAVTPGSPVWRAGLRAGYGLISVDAQAVHTPEQFFELLGSTHSVVTIQALDSDGDEVTVQVQPAVEEF